MCVGGIIRKSYRACRCRPKDRAVTPAVTGLMAPPAPARLIPRGKLGVSVWVEVLLVKFHHGRPTNRLLLMWSTLACPGSPGTIAVGFERPSMLLKAFI